MTGTHSDRLVDLARRLGVLRATDLNEHGIPRVYLTRLVADGVLERSSRGVYVLAGAEVTENHSLAEACRRVPHGVVCLLSALQFHGLTTQSPFEVWLAIDRRARLPKVDYPPLRVVRFSGPDLVNGVVAHTVEGVAVKVTDPARTVADCFAYRNTVGTDVALEALRDCLRQKRASPDDLYRAAKARRMANVMRPYLEATPAGPARKAYPSDVTGDEEWSSSEHAPRAGRSEAGRGGEGLESVRAQLTST